MYEIFLMFPFRTKILEPPVYTVQYIVLYIYQLSLVPPPPIFIRGGPHATVHTRTCIIHSSILVK